MEFCPNCGTRLIYKSQSRVKLYCSKCKKKLELSKRGPLKQKIVKSQNSTSNLAILDRKVQKFRTLPTVNVICAKCEGNKAETWSIALGSEDNSQATIFRCTSCRHTWRETE